MINTVLAVIISIAITGIIFAITEGLLRLLHIKHPKNVFWLYFIIMIAAFTVIPLSLMAASTSSTPQTETNELIDISQEISNHQTQSLNTNKTLQSKLVPVKTPFFMNGSSGLRYVYEISWYDYYLLDDENPLYPNNQQNTITELPLTQSTNEASVTPPVNLSIYASLIYYFIIIGIVSIGYLCFSFYIVKKRFLKKLHARPCTDKTIISLVKQIARELNIAMPTIYVYDGSPNAFVIGQPAILVYSQTLRGCLSEKEFTTAIRHELTHIKHHDVAIKTILQSMRIFFFFNPFVHILVNKMIKKRELLADATYLASKKEKITFMEALIKITEYSKPAYQYHSMVTPVQSLALVSLKATHPSLSERFQFLFDTTTKKTIITMFVGVLILLSNAPLLSLSQGVFISTETTDDSIPEEITFEGSYYSERIAYTTFDNCSQDHIGVVVHKTIYNIISIKSLSNITALKEILSEYITRNFPTSMNNEPF